MTEKAISKDNKVAEHPVYVVGVGASAGGLDAIQDFFSNMPTNSGAAYVVIQHLSPDFKSLMDEILSSHTEIPVQRVDTNTTIKPDNIYLIPPKKNMILSSDKLILTDQDPNKGINLPIDIFFRSLAQEKGRYGIGVILSGSGSDGSHGVRAINEAGGIVMVQDPESAKFDGMPNAALSSNTANYVLRPERMAEALLNIFKANQETTSSLSDNKLSSHDQALRDIFELLRLQFGIDFRQYRATTIDRRIDRRMGIVGVNRVEEYVDILAGAPGELDKLYHDLLIGVTKFFRDPAAFDELISNHFENLFERAKDFNNIVRVWVPGCATGEEAYSLAIALSEFKETHKYRDIDIKVFSTDVHRDSLEKAAIGSYEAEQLSEVPKHLLERHFNQTGGRYQVLPHIRKLVVFAPQNLISDPPFTKIDLVSCRNVLIYLEPTLQHKVISLFHFALRTGGVLFLGPSESIGALEDEFDSLSQKWNIFSKRRDRRLPDAVVPITTSSRSTKPRSLAGLRGDRIAIDPVITWAYEALLNDYCSSGFLVDDQQNVIHIFGDAHQYLHFGSGRPSNQLFNLVDSSLKPIVNRAMHHALRDRKAVRYENVQLHLEGQKQLATFIAKPIPSKRGNSQFLFCYFEEIRDIKEYLELTAGSVSEGQENRLSDLETELQYTREHLQALNEELETSNEELQATNQELVAANEELQSTNEELQSTNEELQSTNEELHSVNEELHTVNAEHQRKIEELTQLTTDMEHLLISTEIGTVFLDEDLRIRKFTPSVAKLMNLLERDIGRPLTHISNQIRIDSSELERLSRCVLDSQISLEQEVRYEQDQWLNIRVLPYRINAKEVKGVVLTFFDITDQKKLEQELRLANKLASEEERFFADLALATSKDLHFSLRELEGLCNTLSNELGSTDDRFNADLLHFRETIDSFGDIIGRLRGIPEQFVIEENSNRDRYQETISELNDELSTVLKHKNLILSSDTLESTPVSKKLLKYVLSGVLEFLVATPSVKDDTLHIGISEKKEEEEAEEEVTFKIGFSSDNLEKIDNQLGINELLKNEKVPSPKRLALLLSKYVIKKLSGDFFCYSGGTDERFFFVFSLKKQKVSNPLEFI